MERYQELVTRLYTYVNLRQTVNTSDGETVNQLNIMDRFISEASKPMTIIQKYLANFDDLSSYLEKYPKLKVYEYYFSILKRMQSTFKRRHRRSNCKIKYQRWCSLE